MYASTFRDKAPPIEFLNQWLATYGLPQTVPDKYVRLDLGGELGRSPEVIKIFSDAGYHIETTAANSSHQNGPGERPHRTIGEGIRALLGGANLEPKFWPYAFHHFVRLYNVSVHGNRDKSCYELLTGKKPEVHKLRTFGCRIFSLASNTGKNYKDKAVSNVKSGIFLGYNRSMKTALCYNPSTGKISELHHVTFDEGFAGDENPPPNARLLRSSGISSPDLQDAVDIAPELDSMDISLSPFTEIVEIELPFKPSKQNPLGLSFSKCGHLLRAYVDDIDKGVTGTGHNIRQFRRKFIGSYILSIDNE